MVSSAHDLISRRATSQALDDVAGGSAAVPFVSMFYGTPFPQLVGGFLGQSPGRVHTITQGEGGEQGDATYAVVALPGSARSVGESAAVVTRGRGSFRRFLDDVNTVSMPDRVCDIHRLLEESLWAESGIRVHEGKTLLWNATGESPPGHERLQRAAVLADPAAVVWRGSADLPSHRRGIKVLGTPLGHQDFVRARAGDAQRTSSHTAGPHSHGRGCALGVVASGSLRIRSGELCGQSG